MKRRTHFILANSLILIVCLMSIGYSVLNRELNITGEFVYKVPADIRITNVKLGDNKAIEKFSPKFSSDEIILGYELNDKDSYITYKIEVTNFSDFDMGILKIEGVDNLELEGYTLKTKLVDTKGNSKAGMIKEFTITLRSVTDRIRIYFEPIYQITYDGFSNTISYKKEIMESETLRNTFTEDVEDIIITMNDKTLLDYDNHDDYQFVNKELVLENVNGNILIENNTPNAPVLNGDMIPVYYDEKVGQWKKADINNLNNNWYDYKTQKWANAVTIVDSSYKEKPLGNVSTDLTNQLSLYNYKSTNQSYNNTNSNFTLSFTTGSNGGTLSFDYEVLGQKKDDYFLVKLTINGVTEKIDGPYASGIAGITSKSYSKELTANAQVTITADYPRGSKPIKYESTAYIRNLSIPEGSTAISNDSTGEYPWTQEWKYFIATKYEIDNEGKFVLSGNDSHDFNTNDIGKFICADGGKVCTELYEITNVVGNTVKSVNKYSTEQFKARETYKNNPTGTEIKMGYINTMWVWIPRYSYTIKSEDEINYYGKATFRDAKNPTPTIELPGEIDIKFISVRKNENTGNAQYTGNKIKNWRTNDAFNFPETDAAGDNIPTARAGLWVSKFEPSGSYTESCKNEMCDVSGVTIIPNQYSIRNKTLANFFYMSRSMQMNNANTYGFNKKTGDLHMMKNDEWGSVVYLSQSRYGKYGNNDYTGKYKEIYQNKSDYCVTGSSNGTPPQDEEILPYQYTYDNMTDLQTDEDGNKRGQAGPGASNTGTIYGIYDIIGGAYEYVMGVLEYDEQGNTNHAGKLATGYSGFIGLNFGGTSTGSIALPNKKYYNVYKTAKGLSGTWENANVQSACDGEVCYGHSLTETRGWYATLLWGFVYRNNPWISRSDNYDYGDKSYGMFEGYSSRGGSTDEDSCRLTLIP